MPSSTVRSQLKRVKMLTIQIHPKRHWCFILFDSEQIPQDKLAQVREDDSVYVKRILLDNTCQQPLEAS